MVIYKSKSPADTRYECPSCNTTFSLADLEFDCQHKITGKYTVRPDVQECPFCYATLDTANTLIVPADGKPRIISRFKGAAIRRPEADQYQNCLSGSHTINPQVDWESFDYDYGHLL